MLIMIMLLMIIIIKNSIYPLKKSSHLSTRINLVFFCGYLQVVIFLLSTLLDSCHESGFLNNSLIYRFIMDEESLSFSEISDRISPYLDQSLDSNDMEILKPPASLVHKSEHVVMIEEDARTGFEPAKFPKGEKVQPVGETVQYELGEKSYENQAVKEKPEKIIDFDSEKIQFKKGILNDDTSQEEPYSNIAEQCSENVSGAFENVTKKKDSSLINEENELPLKENKRMFDAEFDSKNLLKETSTEIQPLEESKLETEIKLVTKTDDSFSDMDSKMTSESEIKPDEDKLDHEFKNIGSEEARMGFETEKNAIDDDSVNIVITQKDNKRKLGEMEEDSVNSMTSQKSSKRKSIEEDSNMTVTTTNADTIFEYQWPPDQGDYFMVQEQVSEYLGIKSFKRKYPELFRRSVEMDEREYLRERIAVSETQCDLGLTAVKSEDVIELMAKDYPEKYQEYERVVQERESKLKMASRKVIPPTILRKLCDKMIQVLMFNDKYINMDNILLLLQPNVLDKTKISDLVKRTVQAAAEYNARFNQERREGRKACVDLQTRTINYPTSKTKNRYKDVPTNYGKYPLALIPGQFQEYYRSYTPSELKYLPLNTVVYGPPPTINGNRAADTQSDDSMSDSDDSSSSGDSSSSQDSHDGSADSIHSSSSAKRSHVEKVELKVPPEGTFECRVCHKWEENKEVLVQCSDCKTRGHPTCLQLTDNMVAVIKTYDWQCMECKSCVHCENPYDEDKMMFCDKCDRGYHTFCVGVRTIPSGRWICKSCGQCATCGAVTPGPEGSTRAQWQNEYAKNKNGEMELVRTLCISCAKFCGGTIWRENASSCKSIRVPPLYKRQLNGRSTGLFIILWLSENKVAKTSVQPPATPIGKRGRGRPRKIVQEVVVPEKEVEISEKKEESACSEDNEKDSSEVEPLPPRRVSRRGVTDDEK
ncbi:PHD finger protein 10 [Nymphon striatum]|nr:PHD finger protein 10 [Nymphon striatum]